MCINTKYAPDVLSRSEFTARIFTPLLMPQVMSCDDVINPILLSIDRLFEYIYTFFFSSC